MALDTELLQRTLSLSPRDRVELADRLLSSVDEDSDEVLRAWSDELDRRADEIDQGKPVTVDRATAMGQVRKAVQRQRQAS
ncbi:MAG: addiction module protein [Tepidisphaerales bacterium]